MHPADSRLHGFTHAQVHAFLLAVQKANQILNPLQRCLDYPDPPGSHWSPASVKAYCQYYLQSTISPAEVKTLIRGGQADELDRRLAAELNAQSTQPQSIGLLDHTYFNAFDSGSFDDRLILDAWKRAAPNSAFAYAASGFDYVAMAAKARGGAYIQDTPQSNIDAMDRLLQQADIDLQHAIALNPKITPAYVAMIKAGSMALGRVYVERAARLGLTQAPSDYAIYGMLTHAEEPKWGGSLQAMKAVDQMAQAHVKSNPLLAIIHSAEPLVVYDVCDCTGSANWSAFPVVFDNLGSTQELFAAGDAARRNGHFDLAAIYLSEGLRFVPDANVAHQHRDLAMIALHETDLVLDDATRWIQQVPDNPLGYEVRSFAYSVKGDQAHAISDLQQALVVDPGDFSALVQLSQKYSDAGEWSNALRVSDEMIRTHPEDSYSWVVRAMAQRQMNSPGLEDTARYFLTHFGNQPGQQQYATMMRAMLAELSTEQGMAPGKKVSKSHAPNR